MTASSTDVAAPVAAPLEHELLPQRLWDNVRTGNLGSWPVVDRARDRRPRLQPDRPELLHAGNFTNIITQMAGTCLLAYGVVFVLLIGEIDLSIALRQRRRRRRRREAAQLPDRARTCRGTLCIFARARCTTARSARSRARSSR